MNELKTSENKKLQGILKNASKPPYSPSPDMAAEAELQPHPQVSTKQFQSSPQQGSQV